MAYETFTTHRGPFRITFDTTDIDAGVPLFQPKAGELIVGFVAVPVTTWSDPCFAQFGDETTAASDEDFITGVPLTVTDPPSVNYDDGSTSATHVVWKSSSEPLYVAVTETVTAGASDIYVLTQAL